MMREWVKNAAGLLVPRLGIVAHTVFGRASQSQAYKYIRLNISSASNSASTVGISEVRVSDGVNSNNILTGSVISSSSASGANTADKAIDGNSATYWQSASLAATITFEMPVAKSPVLLTITPSVGAGRGGPTAFTVDVSNDGSSWTTLRTFSNFVADQSNGSPYYYPLDNTLEVWELYITAGSAQIQIAEFELRATNGGASLFATLGGMPWGNCQPTGGSNGFALATNGNTGDWWINGSGSPSYILPARVGWIFPVGTSINPVEAYVRPRLSNTSPSAFQIRKSVNGGASFSTVATKTATWTSGTLDQTFSIP